MGYIRAHRGENKKFIPSNLERNMLKEQNLKEQNNIKKAFYIWFDYLSSLSIIAAIFMLVYAVWLCYHTIRWWIALA